MNPPQPQHHLTADTYMDWEATQAERHEYYQGEVFAMSGGTRNHNTATGNAFVLLKQHLKGAPCQVFVADIRVHVAAADAYFYPDVVVDCQQSEAVSGQDLNAQAPVLVLEVLSDSTASWDRGGKFAAYRQLPSLQEYGLIDPEGRTLDLFRRNTSGRFELFSWGESESCEFASLGLVFPADALFEGVVVPVDTTADKLASA